MAAEPRIRHALKPSRGHDLPTRLDSRLAGRARCPGRPFQLPAHASGRRAPPWRLRCGKARPGLRLARFAGIVDAARRGPSAPKTGDPGHSLPFVALMPQ